MVESISGIFKLSLVNVNQYEVCNSVSITSRNRRLFRMPKYKSAKKLEKCLIVLVTFLTNALDVFNKRF